MKICQKWSLALFAILFLVGQVQASTLNEPGYSETLLANVPAAGGGYGAMAFDTSGNVYVSGGTSEVYRITPAGVVTQFGITGGSGYALGMEVIGSTLFVGFRNDEIRTMDLTNPAPTGVLLTSIDPGIAAMGMAQVPAGFGTYGGQLAVGTEAGINIVNPSTGSVTVLVAAGSEHSDVAFTPGGLLLATDNAGDRIISVTSDGTVTTFFTPITEPDGIAVHPTTGEVFVASDSPGVGSITKIAPDGLTSSIFANDADFDSGWYISPIRFSLDGSSLFYGAGESSLDVFEISSFSTGTLYGTDWDANTLLRVDLPSYAITTVGPLGTDANFGGLAFDSNTGIMYMAGGRANNNIYTVDYTTGTATLLGAHGITDVFGLAFDTTNNVLYGATDVGELYSFSQTDGSATLIGTSGFKYLGLAYDSLRDRLVAISTEGVYGIFELNRTDGSATALQSGLTSTNDTGFTYDSFADVFYSFGLNGTLHQYLATDFTETLLASGLPLVDGLTFVDSAPQVAMADLTISKLDTPDPVIAGTGLTYTVRVDNIGDAVADDVVVTDTLPSGVTFVSTTGCAEDPAGMPTCSLGTIDAGGFAQYTMTIMVDPSMLASVVNTATVTTTSTESDDTNNSATAETTVNAEADLSITKMDSSDPFVSGGNQMLTYTIEVSNAGPSDATNVVVTDTLSPLVRSHTTSGCLNDPNGVPDCQLGTIPAGGLASYTITVDLSRAGGLMTNLVSVMSDASDPVGDNDSVEEVTEVLPISIPTLNTLGLLVLILLMSSIGWVAIRRF